MTDPLKSPIEYGPDADDEQDDGMEVSLVQKFLAPIYLVLFLIFLGTASVPVVYLYTIIWMGNDARERTSERDMRPSERP